MRINRLINLTDIETGDNVGCLLFFDTADEDAQRRMMNRWAASVDLLAACERLLAVRDFDSDDELPGAIAEVEAAVKKAHGQ